MRGLIKIILMTAITFGTVGILYVLDPTLEVVLYEEDETRIYIDSLDREVEIPEHPDRIISMAPTITEILYEFTDPSEISATDILAPLLCNTSVKTPGPDPISSTLNPLFIFLRI